MTTNWRTVRVFISSTFRDMHAERDHMVRFVFPRLREELLKRRIHLVDVDLRWGVTEDQDAFDLCMDEIDRCRPRFVCLLGGRYGWIPAPKTVDARLMDQILLGESRAGALTAKARRALSDLYALDAQGGQYRLREKPKDRAEAQVWNDQGGAAVDALQRAGLQEAERSITAAEVHYGALDHPDRVAFRFFYFRDPRATASIPAALAADYREPAGSRAEALLAALKARIRDPQTQGLTPVAPGQEVRACLPCFQYPCEWDEATQRLVHLEAFGEQVYRDLLASVDAEFGTAAPEAVDEFARENTAVEAFLEERLERYVVGSRQPVLDQLRAHAEGSGSDGCLCLVGEPGSGKSALLGWFYRDYLDTAKHPEHAHHLVIPHFVGASPESTDLRLVLRRLCHELAAGAEIDDPLPDDIEKLRQAFPEFLRKAAARKHVVILIDAVNRLDATYNALQMAWLLTELPTSARLILSALPGPALQALREWRRPAEVDLPALTPGDAEAIIAGYLARYRKTLDDAQRLALLAKPDAGSPLYLLVALEELRTLGVYDEITERIRRLPGNVRALFVWVLEERLARDPGFRDGEGRPCGEALVRTLASCLAASRHGLSQRELAEIVAPDDAAQPADALGNVAALLRLLRPYLMQRGELLDFFHGQLREAVQGEYLHEEDERLAAHRTLAAHFRCQADPAGDGTWAASSPRGLGELPYHETQGQLWAKLEATLTDLEFVEAKCAAGMTYDLLQDYGVAMAHGRIPPSTREAVSAHQLFLRARSHAIIQRPDLVIQEAFNYTDSGVVVEQAAKILQGDLRRRPWLRRLNRLPTASEPCLQTMEGHIAPVVAVAVTPDGHRAVTVAHGYEVSAEVRVWDLATGICLRTWGRQDGCMWPVAISQNGEYAAAVGPSGTIQIWEVATGTQFPTLEMPPGRAHQLCFTGGDDQRLVLLEQDDGWVRAWDIITGACLHTVRIEGANWDRVGNSPLSFGVSRDGSLLIGKDSHGSVVIWDLVSGTRVQEFEQETTDGIQAVALSPDGMHAVVATYYRATTWDLSSKERIGTLWVHGLAALAFAPDGSRIIVGDCDHTVSVWELSGTRIRTLDGHTRPVRAVAAAANGMLVVSGGEDCTVRAWDLQVAPYAQEARKHTDHPDAMAMAPNGRRAVTAGRDFGLKIWDLGSGTYLSTLSQYEVVPYKVTVTYDCRHAILQCGDESVRVWHLRPNGFCQTLDLDSEYLERGDPFDDDGEERNYTGGTVAAAASADGRYALTARGGTIRIWDLEAGHRPRKVETQKSLIIDLLTTPDGRDVLVGGADQTVSQWDLESCTCRRSLHVGRFDGFIGLTLDGRKLAMQSGNNVVVWDMATGDRVRVADPWRYGTKRIAVTSDGYELILAQTDGSVTVLDATSGALLRSLRIVEGHGGTINDVDVSPEASLIVTATSERTLVVWDLRTGEEVACFVSDTDVRKCAFGPDSRHIGAVDDNGSVFFFSTENVEPDLPCVTPWILPRDKRWSFQNLFKRGQQIAFGCPCCQTWSAVPEAARGTTLLCPRCGRAIRLNPFTIAADWRPIAAAWRGEKP